MQKKEKKKERNKNAMFLNNTPRIITTLSSFCMMKKEARLITIDKIYRTTAKYYQWQIIGSLDVNEFYGDLVYFISETEVFYSNNDQPEIRKNNKRQQLEKIPPFYFGLLLTFLHYLIH